MGARADLKGPRGLACQCCGAMAGVERGGWARGWWEGGAGGGTAAGSWACAWAGGQVHFTQSAAQTQWSIGKGRPGQEAAPGCGADRLVPGTDPSCSGRKRTATSMDSGAPCLIDPNSSGFADGLSHSVWRSTEVRSRFNLDSQEGQFLRKCPQRRFSGATATTSLCLHCLLLLFQFLKQTVSANDS